MELKIGRRLPSWWPEFMFKVCNQGKVKRELCEAIGAELLSGVRMGHWGLPCALQQSLSASKELEASPESPKL